ncbi:MAG TPA: hypothetical protein VLJ17_09855, partial [Xanthobacteraceae bacterium]|nr:hypothetical protein [Xanthobacteraceae bacterium]
MSGGLARPIYSMEPSDFTLRTNPAFRSILGRLASKLQIPALFAAAALVLIAGIAGILKLAVDDL